MTSVAAPTQAVRSRRRYLWSLPWLLALVGLAVPMVGSGFIGWPFVVGWLVVLLLVWWVRPLGRASRAARLGTGVLVIGLLALLGTLGGFYLVPAVIAWIVLVASGRVPTAPGRPCSSMPPLTETHQGSIIEIHQAAIARRDLASLAA